MEHDHAGEDEGEMRVGRLFIAPTKPRGGLFLSRRASYHRKFSIIHAFLFGVTSPKARYRPSGEGIGLSIHMPDLRSTCPWPFKSTCRSELPLGDQLSMNRLFPFDDQATESRRSHPLTF